MTTSKTGVTTEVVKPRMVAAVRYNAPILPPLPPRTLSFIPALILLKPDAKLPSSLSVLSAIRLIMLSSSSELLPAPLNAMRISLSKSRTICAPTS